MSQPGDKLTQAYFNQFDEFDDVLANPTGGCF